MKKIKLIALLLISFLCFGVSVNAFESQPGPHNLTWHKDKCTWDAIQNVSGYEIEIIEEETVIKTDQTTSTEYNIKDYVTNKAKKYYFRVKGLNSEPAMTNTPFSTISEPYTFSDFDLKNYPKLKDAIENGLKVNYKQPTIEESQWVMSIILEDLLNQESYSSYAYSDGDVNKMIFSINEGSTNLLEGTINIEYNKIPENIIPLTKSIIDKMNEKDVNYSYKVDDLYAINFYLSGNKSGKYEGPLFSNVIKFSNEIIEITEGKNVTFRLPAGAGEDSPLFHTRMGEAVMFYDGIGIATVHATVTSNNILYVPTGTIDYLKAAQERLNNYLGKDKAIITKIGTINDYKNTISSSEYDPLYIDYIFSEALRGKTSDGNVYNIKLNGIDYPFIIVETDKKLGEPSYIGTNIDGTAKITSDSAFVPLDTLLSIKQGDENKYKDIIKSKKYGVYDINLYSNSKKANIKKLEDGTFKVSIKVDKSLNGKTLIAYYKTSDGNLEEHEAKVQNEFAVFITNHFSEYVLAEKIEEKVTEETTKTDSNPKTSDNILIYITLGIISILSIALTKKNIINYND